MALKTYGSMAVDWENRIDFERLRTERLARAKALLAKSEMGALLCFDMNNVRYLTATHIGAWAQDKISRFTLLPQNDEPILWDFGSAARHHQQNCPWLGERLMRPGILLLRGAMSPEMGRAENVARKIKVELEKRGLHKEPLGIDVVEPPILFALQREGITIVDGQQLMSDARVIKTQDEISLLNHSAMMVDAAYDELYRAMKPGMSGKPGCRACEQSVSYDLRLRICGSCECDFWRALQSAPARLSPTRVLRPGDPVYYDILHSYMGYRTCYYRCFTIGYSSHAMVDAYKRCREYLDAAISLVRPGRTTAEIAAVWPTAQEFGFPDEEAAFALQFGHGIGLAIWEKPLISRLVSLEHSHEIKPGMVFALETFWPSTDGWSAARIEEEIVVTETGHEVITRFPAEQLMVAGAHYFTVNGPSVSTTRENDRRRPVNGWWRWSAVPARKPKEWQLRTEKSVLGLPTRRLWRSVWSCRRWKWRRKPGSCWRGEKKKASASRRASRCWRSRRIRRLVEIESPGDGVSCRNHGGSWEPLYPWGETIAWLVRSGRKTSRAIRCRSASARASSGHERGTRFLPCKLQRLENKSGNGSTDLAKSSAVLLHELGIEIGKIRGSGSQRDDQQRKMYSAFANAKNARLLQRLPESRPLSQVRAASWPKEPQRAGLAFHTFSWCVTSTAGALVEVRKSDLALKSRKPHGGPSSRSQIC